MSGINKIGHMIHMLGSSEPLCPVLRIDWDAVDNMSDAWRNPKDIQFADGTLYLHGIDIGGDLVDSLDDMANANFEEVGAALGRASVRLVNNGELIDNGWDPNANNGGSGDVDVDYFNALGTEFASGFLYGAHIGDFDEDMLMDCIYNEEDASGVFMNAD